MKTYKDCEVLYLSDNDLTAHGIFKSFENIDIYDFKFRVQECMYKAPLVIYKSDSRYKVLKSRF